MMDIGGIKDPKAVEMVEIDGDASLPELPVLYEDEPVAARAGGPAKATGPGGS